MKKKSEGIFLGATAILSARSMVIQFFTAECQTEMWRLTNSHLAACGPLLKTRKVHSMQVIRLVAQIVRKFRRGLLFLMTRSCGYDSSGKTASFGPPK